MLAQKLVLTESVAIFRVVFYSLYKIQEFSQSMDQLIRFLDLFIVTDIVFYQV